MVVLGIMTTTRIVWVHGDRACLKGISAIRSELFGAVMLARLMSSVVKAIPEQPARVSLGQYFGNRTAEILKKSELLEADIGN